MEMTARRRTVIEEDTSPIDEAMRDDVQGVADQLAEVLEGFQGIDQGTIKGMLFKVPPTTGKYQYIREVLPPFNMPEIMDDMRDNYGGGDYRLSLFVAGKLRKHIQFSVVSTVKPNGPLMTDTRKDSDIFALIMSQQNSSRQDMMQMMTALNASSQQSSDRMMQMMTILIPAMMGNKEKMTDLLPFLTAITTKPDNGNLKETLETLVIAKGLFNGDGNGSDPADMITNGFKIAGPAIQAVANMVQNRNGNNAQPVQAEPYMEPAPMPALPMPSNPIVYPPVPPQPENPVLALVRDDVVFLFNRGHDPEKTADLVYDTIEAQGVTEDQINELVASFTVSADWLADLAGQGIDLRSNPEWAEQFLGALIAIHTDPGREHDDSGGGTGGATDAEHHGGPSPEG